MGENIPKFSDFAEERPLEGNKIRIDDVLNIDIIILGFKVGKSRFKDEDYLSLQIEVDGQKAVIFTGSAVLIKQCRKYADKMPFAAKIIKANRYYSLS